ncbi:methyl-accepting chemotaxis protein [Marinitoga litoralis]|uniref:methyl-accepting chemotaxis protein n=1 Tax=Marinitoga litoralis TaxID=570855 RepID=UPI00195F9830|nr:methyl-accepting chemotaxis protein [Marinitoga litoralis]MBM7559163.1 methyl-accepting chemotaxis protein [Marinitoga litoralis]
MGFRNKLVLIFLLILVIPFIIIGYISLNSSQKSLENEIKSNLYNIIDSKVFETNLLIENYKNALENIANFQYIPIMLKTMDSYFKDFQDINNLKDVYVFKNQYAPEERYKMNSVNEEELAKYGDDEFSISDYDLLHRKYHPNLVNYALSQNLEDIYLINNEGNIIYSLRKGNDFTANLENDEIKNTSFGKLYKLLKVQPDDNVNIVLSDIEMYNDKPVLFLGMPFIYRFSRYGYIAISVDFAKFGDTLFKTLNKDLSTNIFIINSNNKLITKLDNMELGTLIEKYPKEFSKVIKYKNYSNKSVLGVSYVFRNINNIKLVLEKDENIVFKPINDLKNTLIITITLTIIIALIISFVFSNSITKPIKKIEEYAINVSKGNLKKNIDLNRKDEIGLIANIFNLLKNNMKDIVLLFNKYSNTLMSVEENLDKSSNEIINVTNNTFESFEEIKNNLEVVASSVEETTANIEEIASGADLLNSEANGLNLKTKEINRNAENGRSKIQNMIEDVSNIEKLVSKSNSMINNLFEKSKAIEEIVEQISEISKQTNLLALNAAIEAARAGEAGKGFAVVADEIRKLADESNHSASNISENLNSLVNDASLALNESSNITKTVNQIIDSIKEIGVQMESILSEISNISEMVENTSNISNQQKLSTLEISKAIESISISIQQITEKIDGVSLLMTNQKEKILQFDNLIEDLEKMTNEMIKYSNKFEL